MHQKQHSQMRGVQTPEQIKTEKNRSHPTIVQIPETILMDDLMRQYNLYKSKRLPQSLLGRLAGKVGQLVGISFELCREIWQQIIPEPLRGPITMQRPTGESEQSKQRKCFEQFKKKRVRFFVVVFDDQSSEDEMQEAFEKASFIAAEGRGITIEQLVQQTNCPTWSIKNWSRTKRYSILFFKFDLFENLRYFGNLTKEMIDANGQEERYFEDFKSELITTYEHYQSLQKEFVNSYMEKEDRLELE